ncbi:hypothetical protein NHH03_00580 [Stieleria sp. TO1_6]|uniref:hypothetical protein n=1 Tax=Stieleria tagensis TaxID=2956795 RepID=UPI00209B979C|nr:hypothetical protein [Stieleria tagensis]MCO8120216.1 hypothetical protein [Stieleria tagensis]
MQASSAVVKPILAVLVVGCLQSPAAAWEPHSQAVASGEKSLKLDDKSLDECSGLAFSGVDPNCIWSHNDSGDKARLYAFDDHGKDCGRITLSGVKANDWEDMASFNDGVPRLLVADVGDNDRERKSVSLYLFDEPDPHKKHKVKQFQQIVVRYPDGPQNCESVAVDLKHRRILLFGKSPLLATMHQVPLPDRPTPSERADSPDVIQIQATAQPLGRVAIPLATGMDLCPVTGDLWIAGYLHAYRYRLQQGVSLPARLSQLPEMIELPKLKQIEAIAVDPAGRVWVTSEGKPARLQRVLTDH